jgi:hypothetical protein
VVNREKAGFCPGWDYVKDLGYKISIKIFYFRHQNGSISLYAKKNIDVKDLPNHQKMLLALQWLRNNPRESLTVTARLYFIKQEDSVRKA